MAKSSAKPSNEHVVGRTFRGLTNKADPIRMGLDWNLDPRGAQSVWFEQADNVVVTNTGSLETTPGYSRATTNTNIRGAYATRDQQRLYVVDSGELSKYDEMYTEQVLRMGLLGDGPVYFTEVNGEVYYSDGVDMGMITPAGTWRRWGFPTPEACTVTPSTGDLDAGIYRVTSTYVADTGLESQSGPELSFVLSSGSSLHIEPPFLAGHRSAVYVTAPNGTVFYRLALLSSGNVTYTSGPETLGQELRTGRLDPPRGTRPVFWQGSIYTAETYRTLDLTMVWYSLPLMYHHFDLAGRGIVVPGTVHMMAAHDKGLVIGTEREIFVYTGDALAKLADYGVPDGEHASEHNDKLYFWSHRGLIEFAPFRNTTEAIVSLAPGVQAAGKVFQWDGMDRYVVALTQGGTPYNRRQ